NLFIFCLSVMAATHLLIWVAILSCIVLFSHCGEPDQTQHSGHAQQLTHSDTLSEVFIIDAPLVVNCSVPVCDGPLKEIYCIGPILTAAWQFGLQKSCPGSKIKGTPQSVLDNFKKLTYPINRTAFTTFCDENFDNVKYLESVTFEDWKDNPELIGKIPDLRRRKLALEVHRRWNALGKKFSSDVLTNPSQYPVTPVSNAFIVPGGEFDIYFYWDSYWVIEGLLVSNMTATVRGMISNFANLVDTHGFIPNSGKLQLSFRSQPPLFTQMLYEYFIATGDTNFTRTILPSVEKELQFWESKRRFSVAKDGASYNVFQYRTASNCPRPENFLVDYWQGVNSTRKPEDVWSSTTSACESGWDFSSRWFDQNGTDAYSKKSIHTNSIVPVDLNTFMAWNYKAIAIMYKKLNETSKSDEYRQKFSDFSATLDKFFWDEKEGENYLWRLTIDDVSGMWLDYDIEQTSPRRFFYPSNLFPLLVQKTTGDVIKRVGEYLEKNSVFTLPGGIPSTLPVNSTEQWDFPNVWAPTLHLFVMSLLSTRDAYLVQKAKETADRFTSNVYQGMFEPQKGSAAGIWEKYDARKADGSHGGGGEYPVQEGFGWTNGAVLHLIMMFDQPQQFGFARRLLFNLDTEAPSKEAEAATMLGAFPNNFVICGLLFFCFCISILFVVVANYNLKRILERRRDRHDRSESDQMNRLLRELDSDDE
ncbi:tre-4, partial [Pristionchus pacificus]